MWLSKMGFFYHWSHKMDSYLWNDFPLSVGLWVKNSPWHGSLSSASLPSLAPAFPSGSQPCLRTGGKDSTDRRQPIMRTTTPTSSYPWLAPLTMRRLRGSWPESWGQPTKRSPATLMTSRVRSELWGPVWQSGMRRSRPWTKRYIIDRKNFWKIWLYSDPR